MKILKEDENIVEEALPVSFVTDMISKGWDEVGYLKEAVTAVKETYKDAFKIESIMQDLVDAYLVFIGQLESYLDKEKDIATEVPDSVEETSTNKFANLPEEEIETSENDPIEVKAELPEADLDIEPIKTTDKPEATEKDDTFDFFVDFDEPDMSQVPLSDSELYDEDGKPKMQTLNG